MISIDETNYPGSGEVIALRVKQTYGGYQFMFMWLPRVGLISSKPALLQSRQPRVGNAKANRSKQTESLFYPRAIGAQVNNGYGNPGNHLERINHKECPAIYPPFGCDILESFSIQFRRGLFYTVTIGATAHIDTE